MMNSNRMRALEEHSRGTNEEIRTEIKMQGTELHKKIEQLQLQINTVLTTLNSFKANQKETIFLGRNGDIMGIQEGTEQGETWLCESWDYLISPGKNLVVG
ncbi:hypothetical protein OIU85_029599 [Salix viminalis]|uniref:Uncharacterized protein n=1 Tax=Salix viminalis TaxID=40686 RepID=A0A9Q0T7U1_SALVM|nr:hypothetical protein OIU85_029599 [Salix viminalis]